jgi:Synapsin, ATP binding domain
VKSCNEADFFFSFKVASTHAGYGKIRVTQDADRDDLKSILALHRDYYTVEPLVGEIDYEYRIQKIGDNYR